MTIEVLLKLEHSKNRGKLTMATTPLNPSVQEEIDAGNVYAATVKSGPLGLATGEVFLILTDAGKKKIILTK